MKVIIVRDGSAILTSAFGQQPISAGDVIVLGPNVACRSEPEGQITVTTLYADTDYLIDQAFWQHAAILHDRLDAPIFVRETFAAPAQVIHLDEHAAGLLMPWLDELVALSLDGGDARFLRMQALWFAVTDRIAPHLHVTDSAVSPVRRTVAMPTHPRVRRFAPIRDEAVQVHDLLRGAIAAPWTLGALAETVHLSAKQLARVFVAAYGKTPQAFLAMVRVEEMARLLRETDLTVVEAGRQVGWRSRSQMFSVFRQVTGLTPSGYRKLRSGRQ